VNFRLFFTLAFCCIAAELWAAEPEVNITGGSSSLRKNILQQLSIVDEKCKAPAWRLNAHLEAAESEILRAAQAMGYYHLTYESGLRRSDDCWALDISLTPGDPVRVKEVRIDIMGDGRLDSLYQAIYDEPGIKVGDRLHHGKYETLKTRFESAATAHGYFDGYFALSRILVDENEKSAVIELTYDTGKRYKLGNINIDQDILSSEFVHRYLNIDSGDDYDTEDLLELKNLYNASNYFASTSVNPDLGNKQNYEVEINITLDERKRREYSIGGGYATDSGPRVLLGFQDRYINRRGHFFNADMSAAETKKEAQMVYTIPMENPAFEFLKLFTGYEKEEIDDRWSRKRSVGASYTHYQQNKWLQTYALSYEREDSLIGTGPVNTSDLIIPSFTMSRTKTNGVPYPLKGWVLSSRISGSPESLGSDYSFLQWYTRGKYIWGGDFGRILFRSEIGVTKTDNFSLLPISVRYFAGGDVSVRGYDYKSLGEIEIEEDENGEPKEVVVGGGNLITSSIEYDRVIGNTNWVGAVFYDVGNAYNGSSVELKSSVGAGVRWISPIGPIRIDLAKALNDEKSWAIHVTMGPDL
jgi:translocation and assembly module TamA